MEKKLFYFILIFILVSCKDKYQENLYIMDDLSKSYLVNNIKNNYKDYNIEIIKYESISYDKIDENEFDNLRLKELNSDRDSLIEYNKFLKDSMESGLEISNTYLTNNQDSLFYDIMNEIENCLIQLRKNTEYMDKINKRHTILKNNITKRDKPELIYKLNVFTEAKFISKNSSANIYNFSDTIVFFFDKNLIIKPLNDFEDIDIIMLIPKNKK